MVSLISRNVCLVSRYRVKYFLKLLVNIGRKIMKTNMKLKKIICILMIMSMVISNSLTVSAKNFITVNEMRTSHLQQKTQKRIIIKNSDVLINGKRYTYNSFKKALDGAVVMNNTSLTYRGTAAALYFVPGIGQVLITVTGVVIVAGVVVCAGTWVYNQAIKYYKEHTKNKRKSTHDKHTKARPGRETEKKKDPKKGWQKRK